MKNFAEIGNDNLVKRIIVIDDKKTHYETGVYDEKLGEKFCQKVCNSSLRWRQVSEICNDRRYAEIGFFYDENFDGFISQQPFKSWILDENSCKWKPPINVPELTEEDIKNHKNYVWDESKKEWNLIIMIEYS